MMSFACSNIPSALKLKGVKRIEVEAIEDHTNNLRIMGETNEDVHKARSVLEFSEESIQVQRNQFDKPMDKNAEECVLIPVKVLNNRMFNTKRMWIYIASRFKSDKSNIRTISCLKNFY